MYVARSRSQDCPAFPFDGQARFARKQIRRRHRSWWGQGPWPADRLAELRTGQGIGAIGGHTTGLRFLAPRFGAGPRAREYEAVRTLLAAGVISPRFFAVEAWPAVIGQVENGDTWIVYFRILGEKDNHVLGSALLAEHLRAASRRRAAVRWRFVWLSISQRSPRK